MAPKRKQRAPPPQEPSESEQESEQPSSDPSSSDSEGSDFPSGASSSEESSDDEAGEAFEQVDVDFGFYCPQEKDFHGLRTLLQNYLDGQEWACSELADAIIRQGDSAGVGSVVKCGEEDDPIGVSTVLPLSVHRGAAPLQQLRAFLAAAAGEHRQRLEQAWDAPDTGLVVNERLVNCPPELAEPLQDSLFGEVAEAAEDGELPQAERDSFKLKRFLMVVRAYADPAAAPPPPQQQQGSGAGASRQQQQQPKKKKTGGGGGAGGAGGGGAAGPALVHFLPEAECYQAAAEWSFSFPVADRLVGKDDLQPCRCVMLLSGAQVAAARRQLATLMQAAAAAGDS